MPLNLPTSLSRHRRRKESTSRSQTHPATPNAPATAPTNEPTNYVDTMNSTPEFSQGENTRLSRLLAGANRLGKRAGTFPRFGRRRENASAATTPASSAPATPPTPASLTWPPAPVQWTTKPTHVVKSEQPSVAELEATTRPSPSVRTISSTGSETQSLALDTADTSARNSTDGLPDPIGPPPPIPPRRRSSLANKTLPQKCRYDPLTDMYIPVPNPLRVRTSLPPPVGALPSRFEIKSVIDPIQCELRDLADSAEARQQEKKAKFQEIRKSQMEDMMVQFDKVEKEMQLLRGRLGSLDGDETKVEAVKNEEQKPSQSEQGNLEDEESRKSRDSGIGMEDQEAKGNAKRNDSASSSPVDEERRRRRASAYWNSLRDDIRLNEESGEESADTTPKTADSPATDGSPTHRSKARVQTWSPHPKIEAALNRPSSEQKKNWRKSLIVPPELKEQLGKKQSRVDS